MSGDISVPAPSAWECVPEDSLSFFGGKRPAVGGLNGSQAPCQVPDVLDRDLGGATACVGDPRNSVLLQNTRFQSPKHFAKQPGTHPRGWREVWSPQPYFPVVLNGGRTFCPEALSESRGLGAVPPGSGQDTRGRPHPALRPVSRWVAVGTFGGSSGEEGNKQWAT